MLGEAFKRLCSYELKLQKSIEGTEPIPFEELVEIEELIISCRKLPQPAEKNLY